MSLTFCVQTICELEKRWQEAWKRVPWGWDVGRGEVTWEGGEPWARGRVSGLAWL